MWYAKCHARQRYGVPAASFELMAAFDADYILVYLLVERERDDLQRRVGLSFASSGTGSWGQSGTALMWSRLNTNETNASCPIETFDSHTSMSAGLARSVGARTIFCHGLVHDLGRIRVSQEHRFGRRFTTSVDGHERVEFFSSTSTNANSFSSSFGG